MKLSYYPGCSLESTAKEYDMSARSVCDALGIELVEVDDWNCCGATSAHSINRALSIALPARNIAFAQEAALDMVIPCAACFNMIKKSDFYMSSDNNVCSEIEKIVGFDYSGSVKIMSLPEALVNHYGVSNIAKNITSPLSGLEVVCYYGCLLVRPAEITGIENPENPVFLDKLVQSLGATVKPWSYKVDCCGASLGLINNEVVSGMVNRLINAAREAGAQAIVTACPLCHSNLEMRRNDQDKDLPVFYFTELIGLGMGLPETEKWINSHLIDSRPLLHSLSLI